MKRRIAILLSIFFIFQLCSCAVKEPEPSAETDNTVIEISRGGTDGDVNKLAASAVAYTDSFQSADGSVNVEINLEDIYALDPDIIFMSEFGDTGLHTLEDMFGADPVWQELRAVKNNRVIALEKALFHNKANKNYNESYRTMAQYLYPDCEF